MPVPVRTVADAAAKIQTHATSYATRFAAAEEARAELIAAVRDLIDLGGQIAGGLAAPADQPVVGPSSTSPASSSSSGPTSSADTTEETTPTA